MSLENRNSITELLAISREVRFLDLGGDHLAETMIMGGCLLVVSTCEEACQSSKDREMWSWIDLEIKSRQ